METVRNGSSQLNSALFIDFDNIFSNLVEQDRQIAEQFGNHPERWLSWLEKQLPMNYPGGEFTARRLLIRRCYLNPAWYAEYRPHFIRTACEVIDCPPLTARGKTSTDIHMVMDMLDALAHNTYFHEFIILSGDADFTPVLLRLRKHARHSVVLSVGYASPAYKASCDYLINQSVFMESGLGINFKEDEQNITNIKDINASMETLLGRIAERVYRDAALLPSGIPANDLPELYKEFPEFRQSSHWLGFYSLKRLTAAVVQQHHELEIVEDEDSWFVSRNVLPDWVSPPKEVAVKAGTKPQNLQSQISDWIKNLVNSSTTPVALSVLAQGVLQKFKDQGVDSDWLNMGTFKNLLQQLDLDPLQFLTRAPGYLYNPALHSLLDYQERSENLESKLPAEDPFSSQYPDLAPLARKIHQLTDTPYLIPDHYAMLFAEIAREVNERGYQVTRTSRTVRDRCIERGAPIARSHVNFVLTGVSYAGHRIGNGKPETAEELGRSMVKNTFNLCRTAQFELSSEEKQLVEKWLLSKLSAETN